MVESFPLKTLRIVDPACGSGVFLIMAFDFMKAELTRVNDKIKDLLPKAEHFGVRGSKLHIWAFERTYGERSTG